MAGWVYRMLRLSTVVGCSVAAFAAVIATSVAGEPVRERGDASVRVLQMNLCDSGHAHCYTGRSVAEASEVIRAEVPDVVTVNEVCQDDVAALEAVLTGGGGDSGSRGTVVSAFQAAWDRRTGAAIRCRNGRPYGIALVARLAATPQGYDAVGGAYPMQDAGSPELRAWLCLGPRAARSRPLGPPVPGPIDAGPSDPDPNDPDPNDTAPAPVAVCTTHLASGSPAVARAQCAYLLATAIPAVRARAGSAPVILGGDLNLRSDDSPAAVACLPADDRRADDGQVQHVVATPELVVGSPRTIAMPATDHPGLLVTLSRSRAGESGGGETRRQ
jgi:endonuclease/exonuclease/phosphatase family protein